ncbi:MAG: cupin domain-containing protein [Henriciella sp.]|uniref:cupin domain-containing protein n=1 Tax=Henriciella sp. TaxID=1968823 RepID=UPI003C727D2A
MYAPKKLKKYPAHLGRGGTAFVLPEMTGGMEWYERYGELHPDDGADGRLVSMHTFETGWDSWEMHPSGHEIVICTQGEMTLKQEYPDGRIADVTLSPGDYVINDPGVWHIADIDTAPASAVFITSGEGTRHRPR